MSAAEDTLGLTTSEQTTLAAYEDVIGRGLTVFYEVGNALAAIRDSRLYRQEYATFDAYCRERWGMVASRARQLIAASVVVENLQSDTTVTLLPTSEWQTRPLARLDPSEQVAAWREFVQPKKTRKPVPEDRSVATTRDDPRLEDEPKSVQYRVLSAKRVILEWALRTLELDLPEPDMRVVAAIDSDAAESAGYEVLESALVERLARQIVKR